MPELPEVETIVRDLSKQILGKKITKIEIRLKKIVRSKLDILIGQKFLDIERRGKYIFIKIQNGDYLVIHLRMTGQLIYEDGKQIIAGGHSERENNFSLPHKHTHFILEFADKSHLYFNDQRQFGYLEIVNLAKKLEYSRRIGIEPLSDEFNLKFFRKIIKSKKNIKAFLLDQKYIAGIGNIYADEILFDAGVLPTRSVDSLNADEVRKIFLTTRKILKKAIKERGTTFNNYVDANGNKGSFIRLLKVYRREGEQCTRCDAVIKKTKVAGRGTRYCELCQK